MLEKSISQSRSQGSANDKPQSGDAVLRMIRIRMAERQQRTERERRDRYGRFGGR